MFLFLYNIFKKNFIEIKFTVFCQYYSLEGIYFFNYTTPEFNVYIAQLPFWTLAVLFCWRGIRKNQYQDWLLFGLFAGIGVLAHYLFLYLLVSLSVFYCIKLK